ncbi:hypothetical protein NC652_029736 [Populus alba x Populus x berolinensis]|nr:hypothetical protein NC652_029736 [Populus alba x Populus x berolinensis]
MFFSRKPNPCVTPLGTCCLLPPPWIRSWALPFSDQWTMGLDIYWNYALENLHCSTSTCHTSLHASLTAACPLHVSNPKCSEEEEDEEEEDR